MEYQTNFLSQLVSGAEEDFDSRNVDHDFGKAVIFDEYVKWIKALDFTHFMTLTYRDAPAYNKKGEPWGGAPSFTWIKKSIESLHKLSMELQSPMFIVVERGKHPANLVALNVPKGQKLATVELEEWEKNVKGRLHLHGMVATVPKYASFFSAIWQQKYGYNKIVPIQDREKVASYCTKYVIKELYNPEFIDNVHHIGNWDWLEYGG